MQPKKMGILLLIVSMIVLAIFGWKEYHRKNENLKNSEPALKISAARIIQEFQVNDSLPVKKYAEKVIEVTGTIKQVDQDEEGFFTVVLGDANTMTSVRCAMDSLFAAEINDLQKGQTISIKGMFTGFQNDDTGLLGSDIILNRCVIQPVQQ